ncbi:hypothetical protein DICPUDRAFT_57144 [Dictyostelium purpureum]|uniref:Cytochrome P450 family protein n=1 Tax=Dictyostelium purpureum TaxID=5786 RepID=F0ZUK9_DICPU|nr:uncharacterized protein DICPUDRAFT_57144 [Dictyostelium purpureum]EGC32377.1 hypothetical protein DICPUDRAFT_57144 [Dictyostelium purpureum]|eukprot:XP_003291107.1 hypothetical protein DICPUDRAFT_57144 [Dictyostelium purpureum]
MNILILLVILVFTYFLFRNSSRISKINSKIPGPIGLPILGHCMFMGGDLHLQFQKWFKKYGNVFRIRVGIYETVVITGYPTLRKAFIENSEIFEKRWQPNSRTLLNKCEEVVWENGERHKILKRIVLSEMTTVRIKRMEDHIVQECKKLIKLFDDHAEDGKPFEINNYLHMFSLNIILRFLFGVDYPYDKVSHSEGIIKAISDFLVVAGNPLIYDFVPIFTKKESKDIKHPYFVTFNRLITETDNLIKKYQRDNEANLDSKENGNIITGLLKEYEKGSITWGNVVNTSIDMIVAGSDTSANTVIFGLISLSNHPEIQTKLHKSIVSTVSPNEDVITHSKYSQILPYLSMVMKETFRKFPSTLLGISHETTQDIEIEGHKIAAGTQIFQNIYSSHRSEEFFPKPDEFIPERFNEGSNLYYGSQTNLLHFGCGVRDCSGKSLATCEIFTILATLANRYEFINPNPNTPLIDYGTFGLTYQTPSTHLIIKKR